MMHRSPWQVRGLALRRQKSCLQHLGPRLHDPQSASLETLHHLIPLCGPAQELDDQQQKHCQCSQASALVQGCWHQVLLHCQPRCFQCRCLPVAPHPALLKTRSIPLL